MRAAIDKSIAIFITVLLGIMLLCVVWQVFSRYLQPFIPSITHIVTEWSPRTEEISRFGLIWLGVIGAGYVTGLKKHLAIDLLTNTFPPAIQKTVGIMVEILVITFAAIVMMYGGYDLVSKTFAQGQASPVLGLPMGWVYLSVPLSGLLVLGYSLTNLAERIAAPTHTNHNN